MKCFLSLVRERLSAANSPDKAFAALGLFCSAGVRKVVPGWGGRQDIR